MNYKEICEQAIISVRQAGTFIQGEANNFSAEKIEHKGLNDLVSYVDKQAEQLLVKALSAIVPSAGFITEEGTVTLVKSKYTWIIDPLDGTTNFMHGLPTYSVSVALYEDGNPVVGIVYELNRDELFYAWKSGGAFLNGKPISVSKNKTLSASLLATGFPYYEFSKMPEYMNLLNVLMRECHGLRRIGSAAVDLAYTACGRFDAYFEFNLNAYDVAGGAFILQEAGGEVFNFSGGTEFIEAREIVATNGLVSKELLARIAERFK